MIGPQATALARMRLFDLLGYAGIAGWQRHLMHIE